MAEKGRPISLARERRKRRKNHGETPNKTSPTTPAAEQRRGMHLPGTSNTLGDLPQNAWIEPRTGVIGWGQHYGEQHTVPLEEYLKNQK